LAKSHNKIIGDAVLKFRKKAGFSQELLAEKAEIHPNYVGRIERGECSASIAILFKIAKALHIRPHKLFLKF
jgi:XRE family transcriptional regulator, regulator of sulfur utilization